MVTKKIKKTVAPKTVVKKINNSKAKQSIKSKPLPKKVSAKKNVKINKTNNIASLKKDEKIIVPVNAAKKDKSKSNMTLSFMYDLAQAFVIAAVILLLTISFFVVGQQKNVNKKHSSNKNYFSALEDTKIVKRERGFFGGLMFQEANSEDGKISAMGSAGDVGSIAYEELDSKIMLAPYEEQKYNYIYAGADFDLFPSEVDVFKRIDPDFSKDLNSDLSRKKISFLDFGKLKNINVDSLTVNEDREYGYSIYLGLKDGSFSFYKNWERWPSLDKICGGYNQFCYENNKFKIENVLSDIEIINISNEFLQKYGLNLSTYSFPEIQNYWMNEYEMSVDKDSYYISETVNVIYPLKINGVNVYNDFGQKIGVSVEVDMREKKVSGLYNMYYQHYESSTYASENDKNSIIKTAQAGGLSPDYYYMGDTGAVKSVDVELGTPTFGLIKTWQYDQVTQKGYELHVPAYIFPVQTKPAGVYFSRDNIIVPAVKDFFSNYNSGIRPFLMDGSEASGVSSSVPVPIMIK